MAGGYPIYLDVCNGLDYGSDTTNMTGTKLTNPTSNNVKSAYTQLILSTTSDSNYMMVSAQANDIGTLATGAIDIAIGAAASEQVIVNNLIIAFLQNSQEQFSGNCFVPISIPSGTRIAARFQIDSTSAIDASTGAWVNVILFDSAFTTLDGVAGIDAVGFSTSTSKGTAVTPSASTNVKGAYAPLTASTSRDYIGFFLGFDIQSGFDNWNALPGLLDLAIGGAGSEKIIIPNYQLNWIVTSVATAGANYINPCYTPIFPIGIPSGTRIAARVETNTASGTAIGVTLYGLYQ